MIPKPFLTFIILFQIFFITSSLHVQACLPEGITFNTLEEIDNFPFNYPDCTIIEGTVGIQGYDI